MADRQRRTTHARCSAHDRTHTRVKFGQIERFDQIIIRPEVEEPYPVEDVSATGQNENRRTLAAGAPAAQQRLAVRAGEAEIQDNGVVDMGRQGTVGRFSIFDPVNGVTILLEADLRRRAQQHVVFHKKYAQVQSSALHRGGSTLGDSRNGPSL